MCVAREEAVVVKTFICLVQSAVPAACRCMAICTASTRACRCFFLSAGMSIGQHLNNIYRTKQADKVPACWNSSPLVQGRQIQPLLQQASLCLSTVFRLNTLPS